jgi:hypothetical protein
LQRFDSIADAIKRAGRNVLVIIDDVDRLHADELLGVMKAVRLLGRFDRVHYLLSYDEATVLDVLEGTDLAHNKRGRARLYLEKIIQYPFALPPIQSPHIQDALSSQLREVADTYLLAIRNSAKEWTAAVDRIVTNTPQFERLTLRSVSRWCNQLDILLALVGPQEVNFTDAALVTYLRLWHNDVYLGLPLWQSELTDSNRDIRNDDLTADQWTVRIGGVLDRAKDDARPETLVSLLASLFPRIRQSSTPGHSPSVTASISTGTLHWASPWAMFATSRYGASLRRSRLQGRGVLGATYREVLRIPQCGISLPIRRCVPRTSSRPPPPRRLLKQLANSLGCFTGRT